VNLKKLSLKNNQISSLSEVLLHQLSSLTALDLSGNWFETIPPYSFMGLNSLKILHLNNMPFLRHVDNYAFAGLISLKEFIAQKNHFLTHIEVFAFRVPDDQVELGDSNPRVVKLGDNNLNSIEYGLLNWTHLETLELYRNPWICNCHLQWVAEFFKKRKSDAAILADSDFICTEPHIFAGVPVVRVDPDEMLCDSPLAMGALIVGIFLFGFLLFTFCSIIILNHMGILPEWVRRYNIFGSGSSLPKYMRVNPKPTRSRIPECMKGEQEPSPGELEWDSTVDIGRQTS
jgi:hypothetical protein